MGLRGGDLLQLEPTMARPAELVADLLEPLRRGRQPDAAALDPARGVLGALQPAVELDGVGVHPGQRRVSAQLADQSGGVERRAAGQLGAFEDQHVALATLGQVVGNAGSAHPRADHHDPSRRR
jgi:hypothetical protein